MEIEAGQTCIAHKWGKKGLLLSNGTENIHVGRKGNGSVPQNIHENNSKWIQDLNVKDKTFRKIYRRDFMSLQLGRIS